MLQALSVLLFTSLYLVSPFSLLASAVPALLSHSMCNVLEDIAERKHKFGFLGTEHAQRSEDPSYPNWLNWTCQNLAAC